MGFEPVVTFKDVPYRLLRSGSRYREAAGNWSSNESMNSVCRYPKPAGSWDELHPELLIYCVESVSVISKERPQDHVKNVPKIMFDLI